MRKAMNVFNRIIVFVVPILFIIGLLRVATDRANDGFLPSPQTFLNYLYSMPNITDVIKNGIVELKTSFNNMTIGFANIDSFESFFAAFGSLFNIAYVFIKVFIFDIFTNAIDFLVWIISFLFGI